MSPPNLPSDPKALAAEISAEVRALDAHYLDEARRIRRSRSRDLKSAPAAYVLAVASELVAIHPHPWLGYEILRNHEAALAIVRVEDLEVLGKDIRSWDTVDCLGRYLTGIAWVRGQIGDQDVHRWARSENLWWRRTALVSTVGLNSRVDGGTGDTTRTLAVCRMLVDDREDMIVKAMSWALRSLVPHDPKAVEGFLAEYGDRVAARVRREVNNKLRTGLKNPRRA